jgi:deoxyadenosine/deoxycytidine kinase
MVHSLRYVAVEGPIGVGKTTLAKRLAKSLRGQLILESPESNPFLDDFYRDPHAYGLPTQLHFLMNRRKSLRFMAENLSEEGLWVSDFLFAKDRLFADLTLDDRNFALYSSVATELAFDLVVPDLVVYLQAPLEVLYDRIEKRGKLSEQAIASNYIERLQRAYTDYFHSYTDTPVLIVNASEIDFAANDGDYERLLRQITSIHAGRHYFNPSPEPA